MAAEGILPSDDPGEGILPTSFPYSLAPFDTTFVPYSLAPFDTDLTYFLTHAEIGLMVGVQSKYRDVGYGVGTGTQASAGTVLQSRLLQRALQRRRLLPVAEAMRFIDLARGKPEPLPEKKKKAARKDTDSTAMVLKGTPVSVGVATARVRVVRTLEAAADLQLGEILVCPLTDVGWTPYFSLASVSSPRSFLLPHPSHARCRTPLVHDAARS
jgi:hypothetical protein